MRKTLACLSTALVFTVIFPAMAEHHEMHKMNAEYQKMDNEARKSLQECLQNQKMSTKHCMKQTKKWMKEQKKSYKKELARKIMNGETVAE